ncbi:MAG: isoprenyl transferase [Bacillota bacterium]|nr:isoprenyl transferase [Bacillota bacterium]
MAKTQNVFLQKLDPAKMPQHIAIIMDGNGRWAKRRLMPRTLGHRAGMTALRKTVETCVDLNISMLTVYAFSTENWKRPIEEVDYLMKLLVEFLHKELNDLHQNNIRIQILGDYLAVPKECQAEIEEAVKLTKDNHGMVFNIALNYGSRKEIVEAIQTIATGVQNGKLKPEEIDENMVSQHLYTGEMKDPDLLIRTAGEMRLSNFLLWQIAYTELVVLDTLWPDFDKEILGQSLLEYQQRDRRFGGLSQE